MTTTTQAPRYGQTKISDSQHRVLQEGGDCGGHIGRGASDIYAHTPISTIIAMHRRGLVELVRTGHKITGALMTELGYRRLAELNAAVAKRAELEALLHTGTES